MLLDFLKIFFTLITLSKYASLHTKNELSCSSIVHLSPLNHKLFNSSWREHSKSICEILRWQILRKLRGFKVLKTTSFFQYIDNNIKRLILHMQRSSRYLRPPGMVEPLEDLHNCFTQALLLSYTVNSPAVIQKNYFFEFLCHPNEIIGTMIFLIYWLY